ncbi:MAG: HAD family phosphatase [Clostridia bacterium]|nr:HAD family phosphatase [Clostridia bacterium]
MNITGAIFDMDGTLLNSMDYWAQVADEYLISVGIVPNETTCRLFLEDGMKNWYSYCTEKMNLSVPYDEAKRGIYELVNLKYDTVVQLKDGALNMLEALYNKGVKMCLATATDRATVEKILKRLNIEKYFSKIFTSGEVGVGKQEPLIYNLALEYLGTPKDSTYVFEDAIYAMRTAYTNGFNVVGVYDKNVYATEDEVKSLCHIYLDKDSKYNLPL